MDKLHFQIHCDGGSRGNPGPSAIGVVIKGDSIETKEYGEYIGITTNNVAEYSAAIFGLKKLKALIGSEKASRSVVTVNADSELLVKQVHGEYKIKEDTIRDLFLELWNLRLDYEEVLFTHVVREKNVEADKLVNYALDKEGNKLL